jgi:hypothetical protein
MKTFLASLLLAMSISLIANAADDKVLSAIEIGSKGIKAIAYRVDDADKKARTVSKIVFDQTINTDLLSGAVDGNLLEANIDKTAKAIASLLAEMKKLDPGFFLLAASSAFEPIKNKEALQAAVLRATGQSIRFITVEDEVYYGLIGGVPIDQAEKSILVDIGSGNTKLGYQTPMGDTRLEALALRYGTVSLKEAGTTGGNYSKDAMAKALEKELAAVLRPAIKKKRGLADAARSIYIVGGDFSPPGSPKPDVAAVQHVFTNDDLQAGTTLLTKVLKDLGAQQRKIFFTRESRWIRGYMLSIYYNAECHDRLRFEPPCIARLEEPQLQRQ